MRACMRVCVCVRACVRVCVRACMRVCAWVGEWGSVGEGVCALWHSQKQILGEDRRPCFGDQLSKLLFFYLPPKTKVKTFFRRSFF